MCDRQPCEELRKRVGIEVVGSVMRRKRVRSWRVTWAEIRAVHSQ